MVEEVSGDPPPQQQQLILTAWPHETPRLPLMQQTRTPQMITTTQKIMAKADEAGLAVVVLLLL